MKWPWVSRKYKEQYEEEKERRREKSRQASKLRRTVRSLISSFQDVREEDPDVRSPDDFLEDLREVLEGSSSWRWSRSVSYTVSEVESLHEQLMDDLEEARQDRHIREIAREECDDVDD